MTEPRLEMLWWRGCPSWDRALEELRESAREAGLDPQAIEVREIVDECSAEEERFCLLYTSPSPRDRS